ncbi:MAG TPA: NADH-quinone oxidoreductase subunit D, partial [Candidatus Limnocylindria bacterium]|nr:NADH-quinone oxidoreductase subunit D [Candidatus Limnocylindria bacterium]
GYGWAVAVVVACSMLTGGAVLLAAARVFGGLGARPAGDRFSEEEGPEPEVEGSRNRTPAVMAWPAVALAAASIAIGVIPGIDDAATAAADRFVDQPTYAREVMSSHRVAVPSVSAPPLRAIDWPLGAVSVLGGVGVAAIALRRSRSRGLATAADRLGRPFIAVRALHSGHVGDYVAWLVAGAALLGGLVALAAT